MDWPGLIRLGLGRLRLVPEAFWRLTPVELMMMLGATSASPALTRARLEELARAHPDTREGGCNGDGGQ